MLGKSVKRLRGRREGRLKISKVIFHFLLFSYLFIFNSLKTSVGGENLKASKVETKLKDGHVYFFGWESGKMMRGGSGI